MTFTIGLLILVNGLVIPLTGYVSALVGSVLGWILVAAALLIGWNLAAARGRSAASGLVHVLDLYLFVSFAMAVVWYTMWALDGSTSRSEHVSVPVEPDASPFFVYLVISYNVVGSFWFIGPARMFPVSTAAYVWGFVVLIIGTWRVFAVLALIVTIQQQQQHPPSAGHNNNENGVVDVECGQSEFASVQQMPVPRQVAVVSALPSPVMMPYTSGGSGGPSPYPTRYGYGYGAAGPSLPLPPPTVPPPPMSIATLRHFQEMSKAAKAANNLTLVSTMVAAAATMAQAKPKDA